MAPPCLSPEVKDEIAQEVQLARSNRRWLRRVPTRVTPQGAPDDGGVSALLSDGHSHVFIAGVECSTSWMRAVMIAR